MASTTASPMIRALAACVAAGTPTVIWGPPGQGKTATIENAMCSWHRHVETVVGSTREATDFLGVMVEKDGVVSYSTFDWVERLNAHEQSLLFLDELTTAAPSTMKAMLRLMQERVVGATRLHDGVSIIAAANDPEDAADGMDLPAPVANRLIHLDWVADVKGWLENLATGFTDTTLPPLRSILTEDPQTHYVLVASKIAGFIRANPHLLDPGVPEDAVKAGKAWASRRSWHNATRALAHLRPDDEDAALLILTGAVGEGPARQYLAWVAAQDLHDPFEVLEDPSVVDWKAERADRLFVLVQAVSALAAQDPALWSQGMDVMTACAVGGKPDAAAPGALTLANAKPKGKAVPRSFADAFSGLFSRTRYAVAEAAA